MNAEDAQIEGQNTLFDGSYEILTSVGRGRNSVVYKAKHQRSPEGVLVALKVLVGCSKDPNINIARMKREALAMLSCVHPNVVKLRDYVSGELNYLAMEYVSGGDLRSALDERIEPFSVQEATNIVLQILDGLEAIHRAGIIHRDIKPENLLVTGEGLASGGTIKIADFGIAFLPTERVALEEASRGIGTFDYLAPETLGDGVCREASDLYSVSVTLYQLLTKQLPFAGQSFAEQISQKMGGAVKPIPERAELDAATYNAFFEQMLSPDVEQRAQSVAEFRKELLALTSGTWKPSDKARSPKRVLEFIKGEKKDSTKEHGDKEPELGFDETLSKSPLGAHWQVLCGVLVSVVFLLELAIRQV